METTGDLVVFNPVVQHIFSSIPPFQLLFFFLLFPPVALPCLPVNASIVNKQLPSTLCSLGTEIITGIRQQQNWHIPSVVRATMLSKFFSSIIALRVSFPQPKIFIRRISSIPKLKILSWYSLWHNQLSTELCFLCASTLAEQTFFKDFM